jgi:hypothetical protein
VPALSCPPRFLCAPWPWASRNAGTARGSGREEPATEQAKVAKAAKDANAPRGSRDESCERYGR